MNQINSIPKYIFLGTLIILGSSLVFSGALAKIGVGMGAGEIRVTEDIKPGGIYELPSLRVFNTGDEVATYGMNVAYHQDNPENRPAKAWFTFQPSTFTLEPGQSEEIFVSMTVPVKALPGDYFAFLESGPVQTQSEGTSVGVAVATKLYFKVIPANIWQAIVYRTSAFMHTYSPWTWVVFGVSTFIALVYFFSRFFSLNIAFKSKRKEE
jgi:hypothetical protein